MHPPLPPFVLVLMGDRWAAIGGKTGVPDSASSQCVWGSGRPSSGSEWLGWRYGPGPRERQGWAAIGALLGQCEGCAYVTARLRCRALNPQVHRQYDLNRRLTAFDVHHHLPLFACVSEGSPSLLQLYNTKGELLTSRQRSSPSGGCTQRTIGFHPLKSYLVSDKEVLAV